MTSATIETVTIMFVDVVGSTALRAKVGEDEAERLRLAADAIVSNAVGDQGGVIVKNLGDGAMAKFAGATAAVDAAVLMQQALERFNRRGRSESIAVRIGISSGDVTVDNGDYFGLPVVEASRLEASARPSSIRCADLVKQLSRGRGTHLFTDLGLLELKGLAEPLRAYEVEWTPAEDPDRGEFDGIPPVLALAGGMPFSGRAEEVQELLDQARKCVDGGFATSFIAGEPGIGKTRLTHEVALRLVADGWQVLAGRCDEDVAVPFQAIRTALTWTIEHLAEGDAEALGRYPGDLARLLPDISKRIGPVPPPLDGDPELERYRLMQAIGSWLESSAGRDPVLLVLDDLHWADKGTLVLLRHLIQSAPIGVFIICTYRDTDVDRAHPLASVLADLRGLPRVRRIALSGLPPEEVREFLERAGGQMLDEAGTSLAEALVRETSGNPFFVSEVLRHLVESGMVAHEDGRWVGDLATGTWGMPEGIREVVGRRLGRLGEDVEDILRAASVIGYEFDVELLAAVVGMSADDVVDALDVAVPANIVVEVGVDRFRFSHALVRETLHNELSSTRRTRQHRKVAMAIEKLHGNDLGPVLAELATHWREATVGGDPRRAIELSIQVGRDAMESLAPDTAARWFATAVEMMDEDADFDDMRGQVLVELADAQIRSGDERHRSTALEAASFAIDRRDSVTAVTALTLDWRTSRTESDEADERKIEMLRTSLASLDLDDVQRADLTGELAQELIFTRDIEGRARALEDFDARLERLGSESRSRVLKIGRVSNKFGSTGLDRMSEMAAGATFETGTWMEHWVSISVEITVGDGERLDALNTRWLDAADGLDPFSRAASVTWRVPLAVLGGDLEGAGRIADELLGEMRELHVPERSVYRATTALGIARERGEHRSLLPFWTERRQTAHASSVRPAVLAWLQIECGDRGAASELLAVFHPDEVADDLGYPMAIGFMSEVASAIGDEAQCRALLEHCANAAGQQVFAGGIHMGSANRLTGLLLDRMGEHDQAAARLQAAIEEATRLRSPTWAARSQLDLASSRLARGDTTSAAASLESAAVVLEEFDLPASQARLAELEQRLGTSR